MLSARTGRHDPADPAPKVGQKRATYEVGGIDEDDLPLAGNGLFEQRFSGLVVKVFLDVGVGFRRDAPGIPCCDRSRIAANRAATRN